MQSSLRGLFQKSKRTFVWVFLQSLTRTWTFYLHPDPPLRMAGLEEGFSIYSWQNPLDIFSKVPTKPEPSEFHFSKDTKQKNWGFGCQPSLGRWERQERIQSGIPTTVSVSGTETETSSLALGICEFTKVIFRPIKRSNRINWKLVSREVHKLSFSAVKK